MAARRTLPEGGRWRGDGRQDPRGAIRLEQLVVHIAEGDALRAEAERVAQDAAPLPAAADERDADAPFAPAARSCDAACETRSEGEDASMPPAAPAATSVRNVRRLRGFMRRLESRLALPDYRQFSVPRSIPCHSRRGALLARPAASTLDSAFTLALLLSRRGLRVRAVSAPTVAVLPANAAGLRSARRARIPEEPHRGERSMSEDKDERFDERKREMIV